RRPSKVKHYLPWLTDEMQAKIERVQDLNQQFWEEANPDMKDERWEAYREADKRLKKDIGKACFRAWKIYVTDEDNPNNPWGPAHRICHAAGNQQKGVRIFEQATDLRAQMEHIQELKFPSDNPTTYTEEMQAVSTIYGQKDQSRTSITDYLQAHRILAEIPTEPSRSPAPYSLRPSSRQPVNPVRQTYSPNTTPIEELHAPELERIVRELNMETAPGPDFVSNRMISKSFYFMKAILLHLFNSCLKLKYFP